MKNNVDLYLFSMAEDKTEKNWSKILFALQRL